MYDENMNETPDTDSEKPSSPRDALELAMGEGDVDAVLAKLKELGFHLMSDTDMPSADIEAETAEQGPPSEMEDEDEDEDEGGMMFGSGLEKLRNKAMKAVKDKYGDF